jgi:AmmeMemoRadiSam system radical SAM enzyme/AmmeMemoRadiSam system protein B/AmmeMemoRadiSam system protein A
MSKLENQTHMRYSDGAMPVGWWEPSDSAERIDCLLCPRQCSLKPGDRGFCFVRENRDGQMVLSTYGKSTGFCIDPIEKKPLNHFYPGTSVLSFGTAGCNLGCKFCQNWDISKSREVARLSARAEPETVARAALANNCQSVAFTYNDPVVWAEYAIDTAQACHAVGIKTVAVTAGYISPVARRDFFADMDAANVDLKAFSEEFYRKITYSHLQPVLDTIKFLKRETDVWFEITNLVIPQANDSLGELREMCNWIVETVGDQVPVHFTAFHPDFRMLEHGATDPQTLVTAYDIARSAGLRYVYVGNVHDAVRQSTFCHQCGHLLIEREGYRLGNYTIDSEGRCQNCSAPIPGRYAAQPGDWGARRQPIRIERYAQEAHQHDLGAIGESLPVASQAAPGQQPISSISAASTPTVIAMEKVTVTSTNSASATTPAGPITSPRPLKLGRLTAEQRGLVLKLAAAGISQTVTRQAMKLPEEVVGSFSQSIVMGVFVTLKRGEVLRGCCGVLGKPMALGPAISSAAKRTATEDQRFTPISACELPYLTMDVTLLGPFQRLESRGNNRAAEVQVGKHGLMIQQGDKSGLLLPSVATERGWGAERFLQAVCAKAGLPSAAWESDDSSLMVFEGETFSTPLSEELPLNLPTARPLPLTAEQLSAYAQIAGQNIVAMVTGGTPSYVISHLPDTTVNAIVLSLEWQADQSENDARQGSALQVSFRPGVSLQSTLFQMCQQAAQMFYEQRFNGQLNIGLTLGFDPAMHGYGPRADLSGIESTDRALVISDARHCGIAFDPKKSPDELRELLRRNLPIGSRDSTVHSVHVLSTMPSVISIAAPTPVDTQGVRPAAVAGKFYPAEDAARRALVDKLLDEEAPQTYQPLAVMVPHAGLKYSGGVASQVWRSIDGLDGRTLLVVSPKHTKAGVNWSVCPFKTWQLSGKVSFESDRELAMQLAERIDALQLDAAAHQQEHGIEVQLPILERVAPQAKVIGLALHGGSWDDISTAAKQLAEFLQTLDEPPLLVISSDMNHYASDRENRRLDRLALNAMASGDPQQLIDVCQEHEISMCGLVPAALVMETLRQQGHALKVIEVDYATSGDVSGDRSQVVGYAGLLLVSDNQ